MKFFGQQCPKKEKAHLSFLGQACAKKVVLYGKKHGFSRQGILAKRE